MYSKQQVRYLGAGLYEDHRRFLVFECCATTLEALLDVAEKPPVVPAGSGSGGGNGGHWASKLNLFAAPARPQVIDRRGLVRWVGGCVEELEGNYQ